MNKLLHLIAPLIILSGVSHAAEGYRTFPGGEGKPVDGAANLRKAEIKDLGGAPALFVDGNPELRLGISNTGESAASLAEKFNTGIRLVKTRTLWMGNPSLRGEFHAQIDGSVQTILKAIPDARIILRLNIRPDKEFLEAHPESRVTGCNGETVFQDRFNRYFHYKEEKDLPLYRPSWASLRWREQCDADIRDALEYIAKQPYARQIIGVLFSIGHTGEFDQWFGGEGWPGGVNGDWCKESHERFRDWLRAKYRGDVSAFRKAWRSESMSFEDAPIVSGKVPRDPVTGLGNPTSLPARADYDEFFALQIPETIQSLCRSVKQASGGRWIAGGMYPGGDWDLSGLMNASPWIDFGAGPPAYFNREPGNHSRHDFSGEEQRRHGKWYFDELDFRTFLWGNVVAASEKGPAKEYGVETLEKTLSVLKREHAEVMTEGMGGYWYEFHGIVYRDPAIWDLFKRQTILSELAGRHDRRVPSEVAVIVEGGEGEPRARILSRLGTPCHVMNFSTLMEADPATLPYKVYLFLGITGMTPQQREFLRANLEKNGNWLVFFRATGALNPGSEKPFDLANSTDLHGIALVPKNGDRKESVMTLAPGSPLPDLAPGSELADPSDDLPKKTSPTAWTVVNDPAAIPLATWKDGSVAAALKKHENWTAVYLASQRVSAPFLRSLVKASGAHQYLDNGDDVIFASGPFLAFHTRTAGTREIKLRAKADLYDLYADKMIGEGRQAYSVPMEANETYLFYLGDPRKELAEINTALDRELTARKDSTMVK